MRTTVLGAAAFVSLLVSSAAQAQALGETPVAAPASTFGNAGQVAIAGDFSAFGSGFGDFAVAFEHESGASALKLAPALDYFIIPQLSLGGQVVFGYAGDDNNSATTFGIAPRVGFNLPLGPMFSLFPRAGFGITHDTDSHDVGNNTTVSSSATYFSLFLYAPFLFHPVPHFFIGLGPELSGKVAGGNEAAHNLRIGLISTVGGYFDW